MNALLEKVLQLVSVDVKELDLRSVRAQIKKNSDQLGHIKTTGKGRDKAAIAKDLQQWLEDNTPVRLEILDDDAPDFDFGPSQTPNVCVNHMVALESVSKRLVKKHAHFAKLLKAEFQQNGNFSSWEDMERRVKGFRRAMILDHKAGTSFRDEILVFGEYPWPFPGDCMIRHVVIPLEEQKEQQSVEAFGVDPGVDKMMKLKYQGDCWSDEAFAENVKSDPRSLLL